VVGACVPHLMSRLAPIVHATDSTMETRIISRQPTRPPSGRMSTLPIRIALCTRTALALTFVRMPLTSRANPAAVLPVAGNGVVCAVPASRELAGRRRPPGAPPERDIRLRQPWMEDPTRMGRRSGAATTRLFEEIGSAAAPRAGTGRDHQAERHHADGKTEVQPVVRVVDRHEVRARFLVDHQPVEPQ
jgi:hypothetical protein